MKNSSPSRSKPLSSFRSLCVVLTFFAGIVAATAQGPVPDSPAIEAKAHAMLAKLTLEQKIELLGGQDSMFTHAMPAIGLPRFKMSDGPVGVRTWGPTTAYTAGAALAATWDPTVARKVGECLGRDARARGVNFLLGPGVNIARSPLAGRNFEYFSEDPFLNAQMVVQYIEGVQSQGVSATVKHFALNDQEYNRHNVSVDVDERTMREIYLPAFEAAVTRAHADAVMNSYNLINGQHATENEFLNLKLLKGEWGFKGVLMSDWDATYSTAGAANFGLDLEMPTPRFLNAASLLPAIQSGAVKEAAIDDKVLRLLRTELRYGFLDRPQFNPADATYSAADRVVALQGARESLTLLKNEAGFLPLNPARVKVIAVIGPNAYPAVVGGGGSSQATAFEPVSMVTGIANLLGPGVSVLYTRGLPDVNALFNSTRWQGNISIADYPSGDFTGTPRTSAVRAVADWRADWWGVDRKAVRSIRYTAAYTAGEAGKYVLVAAASGQDDYSVLIDGKPLAAAPRAEGQAPLSWPLTLAAGQTINVVISYLPRTTEVHFGFGIANEADLVTAEAKQFAAAADAVVLAVGFNPPTESEGHDRTFALPWGQDALVEAVAAANPHTIVALYGGGGMDTRRWLSKVPALLHTYYPGQEGGTAIAEVIFGKHNPEGKLPVSFDRSWEDNPSYPYYYPVPGADASLHVTENGRPPVDYVIPHVKYDDKLMVGYRYWTTTGKHPLYPFGFGLSYTTFSFSNLKAPAAAASGSPVTVSFDVTNTGKLAGAEVAQLYVSDPSATVNRPERELKGFDKVRLAPGETKHVTLTLDARSFSYWSESAHKWTIDPGKFVLHVGDSSENTPLTAEVTLK